MKIDTRARAGQRVSFRARTLGILVLAVLAACGGGGGGDSQTTGNNTGGGPTGGTTGGSGGGSTGTPPPTSPIVYLATQDDAQTPELYLIDKTAAGTSIKLNAPLVAGGAVSAFALSPNDDRVAYIATQDSSAQAELYVVDLATPGVTTKISRPLPNGGAVSSFEFSPDGASIAYVADADTLGRQELYLVHLGSSDPGVKLNDTLQAAGDVRPPIEFSPDGTKVLYVADRDTDGAFQLFLADVANPGAPAVVNGPLVALGSVREHYHFSPDGNTIAYVADQEVDERLELYEVQTATPGTSVKLNGTLVPGGDLCNFIFDPTSQRIAYCADEKTNDVIELFVVDLATPGVSTKINPPLVAGGRVTTYEFGPTGEFIVYRADQDTNDVFELYSVQLATPGVSAKLNGPLVAGGNVDLPTLAHRPSFAVSPDGNRVVYAADEDTDQQFELYAVEMGAAGAPAKLSPALTARGIEQFAITDDSANVVYQALQGSGTAGLYGVKTAAPGASLELSGQRVQSGAVMDFAIAPGLKQLE